VFEMPFLDEGGAEVKAVVVGVLIARIPPSLPG
jgi:hypothetical protein